MLCSRKNISISIQDLSKKQSGGWVGDESHENKETKKVVGDCSFFFFELLSSHVSERNGVEYGQLE